jgi:protoporphyrinogen oxidase
MTNNGENMKVAVIGGGLLGLSLAYEMTKQADDIQVQLFERSNQPGGVAGSMSFGGAEVDRFYHCILSSDSDLLQLIEELGLRDQVRFKETRMGFYHNAKLYPMTKPLELLRFPPLRLVDRLRLAYTILHSRLFIKNWAPLEKKSVEKWLIELGGRRTYNLIWKPLLNAKFDGGFNNIPATYIWSRIVRVSSASDKKSGKELSGHIIGGYQVLAERLVKAIEAGGGQVHLGANIKEIVIENNRACGLALENGFEAFDSIIVTTPSHIFSRLIPGASQEYRQSLETIPYLGIVCLLLGLDRSLTPYYTLNITDTAIPFTGLIETTNLINPEFVNGNHLVYLPKYILPENPLARMPDSQVKEVFLADLKKMFPDFDEKWVTEARVMRERFVEPLHNIQGTWQTPQVVTPVGNLSLANTAQIWPELTNGQSVTTYGRMIARKLARTYKEENQFLNV